MLEMIAYIQFSGVGIFVYKDGVMYDGEWKKGVKEGKGELQFPSGGTLNH